MTIYADVFVIVNLYVDFFLLWCVRRFLRLRASGGRLALGGLCGALCGLVSLLPLGRAAALLAGGGVALAAAAAAFCPLPWRQLVRAWGSLWLFSFLLAGFFLFMIRFFSPQEVAVFGNMVYINLSIPLLFVLTCLAYAVFALFNRLFPRDATRLRICTIVIEHQGKSAKLSAKADTGNDLREPFSGLPVIVCEAGKVASLAPAAVLDFLATKEVPPTRNLRLVPYSALGSKGLLPAFRPEKVVLGPGGGAQDCYIALIGRPLSAGQFAALFNPDAFSV